MFNHYIFLEEAGREHLNDLIKEAELEHKWQEFLKTHPEHKRSSKIQAFVDKVLAHSQKSDDSKNQSNSLQQERT